MTTESRGSGVAGAVRRRRLALGWGQEELARRAGVSVRAIRNIERQRVTAPRDDSLRRLFAALDAAESRHRGPDGPVTIPTALTISVLGPLTVRHGAVVTDPRSRRLRELLGLLAICAPHPVGRDEIIDTLWGDRPPRTCQALVRTYVTRLRKLLEPDHLPGRARAVVPTPAGYRLDVGPDTLDLLAFNDLLQRGLRAGSIGDHHHAHHLLAQALDCWRGPLLATIDTDLVRHPAAVALAERRLSAATAYADAGLAVTEYDAVVDRLRPLVVEEPLHEGLHAQLMLALAATGQQAAAVQLYTDLRTRLDDGLGIAPGPAAEDAYLRVLRQDVGAGGGGAPVAAPVAAPVVVPPAQLPAHDPNFVGRRAHLTRLDELLAVVTQRDGPVVCTVTGSAGVGKTALALHWSRRVRDHFPDGQLYVDLRGFDQLAPPAPPADVLGDFLTALGVAPHAVPAGLAARAALYRTVSSGRRLLVVLDNASDTEQVRPLLPGAAGCFVVVTSRHALTGLVAGGAHRVPVDVMPVDEAAALVAQRVGPRRRAREPFAVDRIVERCGRLPLALTIVAARAAGNPRLSLTGLAAELSDSRRGLDALNGGDTGSDVRAAFSWSYRRLDPESGRMFRLLGLSPGTDITVAAAGSLAGIPPARARVLLSSLARVHLLAEHRPGRYVMHDLLRRYAGELATDLDSGHGRTAAIRRVWLIRRRGPRLVSRSRT
jgi:DNA-binding SARP family transcriptional activator